MIVRLYFFAAVWCPTLNPGPVELVLSDFYFVAIADFY